MGNENVLKTEGGSVLSRVSKFPQLSIAIAFVILFIVMSAATDTFFTPENLINVTRQASTVIIVAIGMTYVLILGGIDLSVGSVACLAGTLSAGFMTKNAIPIPLAIILGLGIGVGIGVISGIMVSQVKIPPFIATLAMMSTARGLSLVYTGGYPITNMPEQALFLGRGYIGKLPVPVLIMLIVLVISWVLLSSTKFGRYIYAIGGNEECSRLSGIKVNRTKIIVYAFCGLMAGISGLLLTMRLASGQPTLGQGMELDAIAACVLGGTSLAGGKGYMLGTIIGCFFMVIMGNGFNILGISSFYQQVLTGIILLVAVSLYQRGGRK